MLSHGDEISRTQEGNNNAYCQDNELTWMNWDLSPSKQELLAFTRKVFGIRQRNPVLRRRSFFHGHPVDDAGHKDLAWYRPDGKEMTEEDWHNGAAHVVGMLINGDASDETDERGRPVKGDTLLLLLNGGPETVQWTLPPVEGGSTWIALVNTAADEAPGLTKGPLTLAPYSLVLLSHTTDTRIQKR